VLRKFVFVGYEKEYDAQSRCCGYSRLRAFVAVGILVTCGELVTIFSEVRLKSCDLVLLVVVVEHSRCG